VEEGKRIESDEGRQAGMAHHHDRGLIANASQPKQPSEVFASDSQ
jgi:hypothetical protein